MSISTQYSHSVKNAHGTSRDAVNATRKETRTLTSIAATFRYDMSSYVCIHSIMLIRACCECAEICGVGDEEGATR